MRADTENRAGHISLHIPTQKHAELVEMVISANQPPPPPTGAVLGAGGREMSIKVYQLFSSVHMTASTKQHGNQQNQKSG